MRVKPRSYPHPVLSSFGDDIVGSQFQMPVKVTTTKTAYVLDAQAKTSDPDLRTLIEEGKAQYAVHVECPQTRYRAIFASSSETFSFEIPASEIDGQVEVCTFVLSTADLPEYLNNRFHTDYKGVSFSVRAADTLAVYDDQSFSADKTIDPLKKIPSIFVIVPAEQSGVPPMDIDLSGNKVTVRLSKPNYDVYQELRKDPTLHSTLNSMIIVPALVAVLEAVRRATESADGLADLESRRWYAVLARKLKDLNIDPNTPSSFNIDSTPAIAHRLIGHPLTDSLKTLEGYGETPVTSSE